MLADWLNKEGRAHDGQSDTRLQQRGAKAGRVLKTCRGHWVVLSPHTPNFRRHREDALEFACPCEAIKKLAGEHRRPILIGEFSIVRVEMPTNFAPGTARSCCKRPQES